jgi:hypothetical protein
MKISKSLFKNYMKCPRYSALLSLTNPNSVVAFSDNASIEELISYENQERQKELVATLLEESVLSHGNTGDEDPEYDTLSINKDEKDNYMNEIRTRFENLAGDYVLNHYKGEIRYSTELKGQQYFSYEEQGITFYCFLDIYQEDEEKIRIFEVKSTTDSSLLRINIPLGNKEKSCMYERVNERLYFRHDIDKSILENKTYKEKLENCYDIYHSASKGKYFFDIAYQRYVIEKLKLKKPVEYYLIILNSQYRQVEFEANGDPIYTDNLFSIIDCTSTLSDPDFSDFVEATFNTVIQRALNQNASTCPISKGCGNKSPYPCPFIKHCFKEKDIPYTKEEIKQNDSIFVYLYGHHGFGVDKIKREELLERGITKALDVPFSDLLRKTNQIQYDVIKSDIPYFDYSRIQRAISEINYPIYHLDFESFASPLPRFLGEFPYEQSLFQFSIHVEHSPFVCDKEKDNYSYLVKNHEDNRLELIEKLCLYIKEDKGTVLVYNKSFENTRIKELITLLENYYKTGEQANDEHIDYLIFRLQSINERMYDLMNVVKGKKFTPKDESIVFFYDKALHGSYSIKKVLPVTSNLSYANMPVGNGEDAMREYYKMVRYDVDAFNQRYHDMIEYCKQDTWSMVVVLHYFINKIKEHLK